MRFRRLLVVPVMAGLLLSALPVAHAAKNHEAGNHESWVGTWGTAPFALANKKNLFATDSTLRQYVRVSLGGNQIRLVLTNEFGTADLKIGGASVALPGITEAGKAQDGTLKPGSVKTVTFGGQPGITIAPGALALSDPIALPVAPLSTLAVSLFIPGQPIESISYHAGAFETNFEAAGNQITAESLPEKPEVNHSWFFLKGVEVETANDGAVVAFGDSITDGARSTDDANHRWPDVLAERLHADKKTAGLAVLNEGIGGNRVLHDGTAPSALARFDRDVLAQPGVRYVIILEGINDIGRLKRTPEQRQPGDTITADDLIAGYKQLILRAHAHGIKIFGATITPYIGAGYSTEAGEAVREKANEFIRSGAFDGVVDFDKATQDPANPTQFLPTLQSGDHLHPSDAGYKVMGDAIDLKLFAE